MSIFKLEYTRLNMHLIRCTGALVSALYLFELIYREKMRPSMMIHHTLTVFATSYIAVQLDKTHDPSLFLTANLWLFQATTEQVTFLALFGYRLNWSPRLLRPLLRFTSIQTLVLKMVSVIAIVYVWFTFQKDIKDKDGYAVAYDVVIWLATIGLMSTQFWGSWVLWTMGNTLEARYAQKAAAQLRGPLGEMEKQQPQLQQQQQHYSSTSPPPPKSAPSTETTSPFVITPTLMLHNRSKNDDSSSSHYYSHTSSPNSDKSISRKTSVEMIKHI
jgi:hypothetical protein